MNPLAWLQIGAGAIAGAVAASLVIAPLAYFKGERAATAEAKTAALETTIELLKSREITNAEISHSDAALLCRNLGLLDNEINECMRRMAEADAKP